MIFFFLGDTWVFIAQNTCQLGFGPFEPGSISVDPPKHSSRQFPFDYSSGKKKKKKLIWLELMKKQENENYEEYRELEIIYFSLYVFDWNNKKVKR